MSQIYFRLDFNVHAPQGRSWSCRGHANRPSQLRYAMLSKRTRRVNPIERFPGDQCAVLSSHTPQVSFLRSFSYAGEPISFLTPKRRRALVLALLQHAPIFRRWRMPGWCRLSLFSARGTHGVRVGLSRLLHTASHRGGGARVGWDVAAVLEGVSHVLPLALLLEASYAVGVDAALGDDIGSAAGWGGGRCGQLWED